MTQPYREAAEMPEDKSEKRRIAFEERKHKRELAQKDRQSRRDSIIEWWRTGDGAKVFAFLTLTLVGGTASALLLMYADHRWFSSPDRCVESAEIIGGANSMKHCPGGRVTTEALDKNSVIFKCTCP